MCYPAFEATLVLPKTNISAWASHAFQTCFTEPSHMNSLAVLMLKIIQVQSVPLRAVVWCDLAEDPGPKWKTAAAAQPPEQSCRLDIARTLPQPRRLPRKYTRCRWSSPEECSSSKFMLSCRLWVDQAMTHFSRQPWTLIQTQPARAQDDEWWGWVAVICSSRVSVWFSACLTDWSQLFVPLHLFEIPVSFDSFRTISGQF